MDRLKLLIPILLLMLLTPALAVDSRTVTDDLGRNVTITGVPNRIVCICPSCTEIAYSLGLGDKVVGVDKYSDYPPEVVKKQFIGNCWKPDPEEVASLKPDLVIMYSFMGKGDPSVKQLEDAGLTVIALHPGNLSDVLKDIILVGEATGKVEEAKALVSSLQNRLNEIESLVSQAEDRPKVYIESYYPPPWTFGPGSWVDQLIKLAGGENAFGDAKSPWVKTTDEEVIARQPEIIVSLMGMSHYATLEDFEKRTGWSSIPAVKDKKVYVMDANLLERPGPRLIDGLESLAKLIHPELFKNESTSTYFISTKELEASPKTLSVPGPVEIGLTILRAAKNETLTVSSSQTGPEFEGDLTPLAYLKVGFSYPEGNVFAIRIKYAEERLKGMGIDESSLRLYRWNGTDWVPMCSCLNRTGDYVEALATTPGYFALAGHRESQQISMPTWLFAVILIVAVAVSVLGTYEACRAKGRG